MIVADASLVLKWIWDDEQQGHVARRYRDQHVLGENRIAVPELLYYEIANVLATKAPLSAEEATEEWTVIVGMELDTYPLTAELCSHAIRLSKRYKISLYDSSYIALAALLGCNFITADASLVRAVTNLAYVKLLL